MALLLLLLVDLWVKAPSTDVRSWLIAHPVESLKTARARPEASLDIRLGPAGEEAHRCLETMRRCALRVGHRIREGLGEIGPDGRAVLASAGTRARVDTASALAELDAWLLLGAA